MNRRGLLLIVGLLLCLAAVAVARLVETNLVDVGNRKMVAQDYAGAVAAYAEALQARPDDASILIHLGDAYNAMTYQDARHLGMARERWEQAARIDPDSIAAHRRLLQHWRGWSEGFDGDRLVKSLQAAKSPAENVLRLEPTDLEARFMLLWADLESAVSVAAPDPVAVDAVIKELEHLQGEDPANPEIPWIISCAFARQGLKARDHGDSPSARQLLNQAVLVIDAAIQKQPDRAALLLRKAKLLKSIGPRPSEATTDSSPVAKQHELDVLYARILDQALTKAKFGDPEYPVVAFGAAIAASQIGSSERAERILHEAFTALPNNLFIRTELARCLANQQKLDEALKVISTPRFPVQPPGLLGMRARMEERGAILLSVELQLHKYSVALERNDLAAATEIMRQIDHDMESIREEESERARFIRLVGKKLLAQKQYQAAIETLTEAVQRAPADPDGGLEGTMFLLGRAHLMNGDAEQAVLLFRGVVRRTNSEQVRIELIRVLIDQNSLEDAQRELDALKVRPQNPEIQALERALRVRQVRSAKPEKPD